MIIVYIAIGIVLGYFLNNILNKNKVEKVLNSLQQELGKKDLEIKKTKGTCKELELEVENYTNRIKEFSSKNSQLEDKYDDLQDDFDDLNKKYKKLVKEYEDKEKSILEYMELYELRKKEVEELKSKLRNE